MRVQFLITIAVIYGMADLAIAQPSARSCTGLTSVVLPETSITIPEPVAAGAFVPLVAFAAAGTRGVRPILAAQDLPEFCRVPVKLWSSSATRTKRPEAFAR